MSQPTFDTQRCCPYHGGWIKLSDCPIVITNLEMLPSGGGGGPARPNVSTDDILGGASAAGTATVADDAVPLADPIGPGAPAQRTTRSSSTFTVGREVTSMVDGVPRLVVALPPPRPREEIKRRRFGPSFEVAKPLPSPASLAAEHGGQRARPVRLCPDPTCLHPLPATIDTRDPISIAMVGNSQASKTTTIAALMAELRRSGPDALGVTKFAPSEVTSNRLRRVVTNFVQGHDTARTDAGFHAALEFTTELGRNQSPVTLMIHDVSGEDIMNPDRRLRWAPYVLWADVLLFIYNPEESPRLAILDSDADQSAVLNGVLDDLEAAPPLDPNGNARRPALVVAVSKADVIPQQPHLVHGLDAEDAVIQTLKDLYDAGVVHAGQRLRDTQWRFISPKPPSGDPEGVTDLFRLVLSIAVQ
jgi:hypothetical protein